MELIDQGVPNWNLGQMTAEIEPCFGRGLRCRKISHQFFGLSTNIISHYKRWVLKLINLKKI